VVCGFCEAVSERVYLSGGDGFLGKMENTCHKIVFAILPCVLSFLGHPSVFTTIAQRFAFLWLCFLSHESKGVLHDVLPGIA
jgi:hypothetical protein